MLRKHCATRGQKVKGTFKMKNSMIGKLFVVAGIFAAPMFNTDLVALTVVPSAEFVPSDHDVYDFPHARYYTWGFSEVSKWTGGKTITSAELTIENINNWDNNDNRLFIWLLDKAKNSYMSSSGYLKGYYDSSSGIQDDFTLNGWSLIPKTKIAEYKDTNGTGTIEDLSYVFDSALLQTLNNYIANGDNFAIGFDPDCHFYNDGVKLTLGWDAPIPPVPDAGASGWLLLAGLGLLPVVRRRARS